MIHNTQGYATLILETGIDLASVNAEDIVIKYQKPSGARGEWEAEVFETTKVIKNFANDELDQYGLWKVQAAFSVAGKNAFGNVTNFEVKQKVA